MFIEIDESLLAAIAELNCCEIEEVTPRMIDSYDDDLAASAAERRWELQNNS